MPYEPMNTTLIPNTTMYKVINTSGAHTMYRITANEGYVVHDNREDYIDPNTNELVMLYAVGSTTVRADYDFENVVAGTITDINGNTVAVNKVGAFELFAVLSNLIPENQIYGGVAPPTVEEKTITQ